MKVPCPSCKTLTIYEGNPDRPFCSERCRMMDLGAWASGKHAIPVDHSESSESDITVVPDADPESD